MIQDEVQLEELLIGALKRDRTNVNPNFVVKDVGWRFILAIKDGKSRLYVPRVVPSLPDYLRDRISDAMKKTDAPIYWVIPEGLEECDTTFLLELKDLGVGFCVLSDGRLNRLWPSTVDDEGLPLDEEFVPGYAMRKGEPYGNILKMKSVLKRARSYLHYLDPYFNLQNLDLVYEALDETNWPVKEIKILTHARKELAGKRFKNRFSTLVRELEGKKVDCQMRVICELDANGWIKADCELPHDRYTISSEGIWNVQPIHSILKGREGDIQKVMRDLDFDGYWILGKDILQDWNEVHTACKRAAT
ncbi:MAG: hypothetical protein V3V98_09945 [Thermoplasmata archaeon]